MPFDIKQFSKAKFSPRTETVRVPALAAFFGPDDDPVFTVRGLTGEELARAVQAPTKAKKLAAIVEAIAGNQESEQQSALRDLVGLSDETPDHLAEKIEKLTMGTLEPALDQQSASKIFRVSPSTAYNLVFIIDRLSGQGQLLGEPQSSGATSTSSSPATSPTPEDDSSTKSSPTASPTAT
jgi:hypothetical protein